MNLNGNAWHVRWFRFVQNRIGSDYAYRGGTNLCHFMRVTMLWGPLVILFGLGAIGVVFRILFVAPYLKGGWLGLLLLWGTVIGVAAAFYLIALAIGRWGGKLAPVGGAISCAYEHAKAVKGKFCPIIKFDAAGTANG